MISNASSTSMDVESWAARAEGHSKQKESEAREMEVTITKSDFFYAHTYTHTTDWLQTGKGVHQGCILSPAYLTYMQSTSSETLDWKKHKLESRLPGEISITSDMQMTPPLWQKVKRN